MKKIKSLWYANLNYWTQERSLIALMVYLFVSIVTWLPFSEQEPWEEALQDLVFNLILLAGYFSASIDDNLKTGFLKTVLGILAIMAFVFRGLEYLVNDPLIQKIDLITSVAFFGMLSILLFRYVVRDDNEVTSHRVMGAIVVYILIGLVCSFLYNLVYLSDNKSFIFSGHDPSEMSLAYLIYFSFTIQTTVGAGDIIPADPFSKSIVIFQSMFGMLYPVVIIARLVSLEIEHSKNKRQRNNY
ncbi:MAG: ion channel [Cyclobacteriaceae bacterium]|jgi:Ion channel